jgi:hypothetical protein
VRAACWVHGTGEAADCCLRRCMRWCWARRCMRRVHALSTYAHRMCRCAGIAHAGIACWHRLGSHRG